MGAACCVAAREKTILSSPWSVTRSPTWNCQWDPQGSLEDEAHNPHSSPYSRGISEDGRQNFGHLLGRGSSLNDSRVSTQQRSPTYKTPTGDSITPVSDVSMGSSLSSEVKELIPSWAGAGPSSLACQRHTLPADSRRGRRSPGHQLLRQISSGRILGLKSVCEGRQSCACSPRERWSFDSESTECGGGNSRRRLSAAPCVDVDMQTCGVCSKLLTDRSPWMGQKMVVSNEHLVVAVLVCGHVYHAECLEYATLDTDKFDPPCPLCQLPFNISATTLRMETDSKLRNRIPRNRVVDSNLDLVSHHWKNGPKMAPSSSTRKPFLRPPHFSLGSKSAKSISHSRKGFWVRYRKD